MTSARAVLGRRGLDYGLWAAPSGVDAIINDPALFTLNMTTQVDQIIMHGTAVGLPKTIALALSAAPQVMLTTLASWNNIDASFYGMIRPFPNTTAYAGQNSYAAVTPSYLYVAGGAARVNYMVFRRSTP